MNCHVLNKARIFGHKSVAQAINVPDTGEQINLRAGFEGKAPNKQIIKNGKEYSCSAQSTNDFLNYLKEA